MRHLWSILACGLCLLPLAPAPAQAQTHPTSAPAPIWRDGIGSGFRTDTFQVGASGGVALGMAALGSKLAHDFAFGYLHGGWMFGDTVASNKCFSGNWELTGDLFGGAQINIKDAYVVGFSPGLRYDFATGTRWVPFVGGALGLTATDIGHPDLSTTFQFNLQPGAGVHYFVNEHLAVTFEYRYLHFSNAGIEAPNCGVNSNLILLGAHWFF